MSGVFSVYIKCPKCEYSHHIFYRTPKMEQMRLKVERALVLFQDNEVQGNPWPYLHYREMRRKMKALHEQEQKRIALIMG